MFSYVPLYQLEEYGIRDGKQFDLDEEDNLFTKFALNYQYYTHEIKTLINVSSIDAVMQGHWFKQNKVKEDQEKKEAKKKGAIQ